MSVPAPRTIVFAVVLVGVAYLTSHYLRPSVLLVGNITTDVVDKKTAVGGAVTYAAAVLNAFGIRACIVTAAGKDADLSALKGHRLHVVQANATLTFEHTYTWWGNKRKLRILAQPNVTLTWAHVPLQCRYARTVLLGPLTPQDMDCKSFVQGSSQLGFLDRLIGFRQQVGFMAQGLQRNLDSMQRVIPQHEPSPLLVEALGEKVCVFLSDIETDVWKNGTVEKLSERSARWLITRGEAGADEYSSGTMQHLPPTKVDNVADTNGAGDTFATAYMLALASGWHSPGRFANWAASRAVMMPQHCKPGCVESGLHHNNTLANFAMRISQQFQSMEQSADRLPHAAHVTWCWLLSLIGKFQAASQSLSASLKNRLISF